MRKGPTAPTCTTNTTHTLNCLPLKGLSRRNTLFCRNPVVDQTTSRGRIRQHAGGIALRRGGGGGRVGRGLLIGSGRLGALREARGEPWLGLGLGLGLG